MSEENTILKNVLQNEAFLTLYIEGMSKLSQSGIFSFLRELGRVRHIPSQSLNYMNEQAIAAAESRGFQEALDSLYFFREKFIDKPAKVTIEPTFGGTEAALQAGNLTMEDLLNADRGNDTAGNSSIR